MKIVYVDKEVMPEVRDVIKEIAKTYRKSLINNTLFELKLNRLTVRILHSNASITTGVFYNNILNFAIEIYVSDCDNISYIAYIIAHEFAHFLFADTIDVLNQGGRSNDNTGNCTAITRISNNGEAFGDAMEESCADTLAKYVLTKMGIWRDSLINHEELQGIALIAKLSSNFGKPIFECEMIDDFIVEGDKYKIANLFWYSIVVFSFNNIINRYDKEYGKNAFLKISKDWEKWKIGALPYEKMEAKINASNKRKKAVSN